jgi:NTE family protein
MKTAHVLSTLIAPLALAACLSSPPRNQPVDAWDPAAVLEESALASPERSGQILLALTFSGGGTRAAAFSYGVLQKLAETRVPIAGESRRLLDEVDLISSVSGGSFTAAYFGLHGDGIFDRFEDVFLRKNVQAGLIFEVLRPRYWLGLLRIDRSQLAARYYDREVFDGATLADLDRPGAPQIELNATDLSTASRFSFVPLWFGAICSDLPSYPISHAVTASSAVPIVFPTVRLRNYAGRCGFEMPQWMREEKDDNASALRQMALHQLEDAYPVSDERPYIHLIDGGVSDNLGLINLVASAALIGDPERAFRELGHEEVRLLLVITVNSEAGSKRPWDREDRAASSIQVVNGLSSAQIHKTNRLTLELAKASFGQWARRLSRPGAPVRFEFIEVGFEQVADPDERDYLRRIETSFRLSDEKVDRLIAAARQVLRESEAFQRALRVLDAPWSQP